MKRLSRFSVRRKCCSLVVLNLSIIFLPAKQKFENKVEKEKRNTSFELKSKCPNSQIILISF
jgi:hypothetical protein